MYNVYGVSNHHGSLNGGHYTAYARNRVNKSWYLFNDSSVSKVSESSVCTSAAYVLFLHQKEGRGLALWSGKSSLRSEKSNTSSAKQLLDHGENDNSDPDGYAPAAVERLSSEDSSGSTKHSTFVLAGKLVLAGSIDTENRYCTNGGAIAPIYVDDGSRNVIGTEYNRETEKEKHVVNDVGIEFIQSSELDQSNEYNNSIRSMTKRISIKDRIFDSVMKANFWNSLSSSAGPQTSQVFPLDQREKNKVQV